MTAQEAFVIAYFLAMALEVILRLPYARQSRRIEKTERRAIPAEWAVFAILSLVTLILPLAYALTPWLGFADWRLAPSAALALGLLGLPFLLAALWVLWRAHRDLGAGWSPTLEIGAGQELVTRGIYGWVRHPMYSSLLLWSLAQPLLLQNWIAGPPGMIAFLLALFVRVPREEQMMLDHFGDEYARYRERVGRIVPRAGNASRGN